jgi:heme exporter protein A
MSRGQVLSLEGANGSGKTSLLRLIAGLLPSSAGSVEFLTNEGIIREPEERARMVAWLGHQDAVRPQFTPNESLAFFARYYGLRSGLAAAVEAATEAAGLARIANVPCQYLSAGQKKRLALARVKLSRRPLWLLDEPFASLDTAGKALVRDLITVHCGSGGTAIVATHEALEIESDRLVLA